MAAIVPGGALPAVEISFIMMTKHAPLAAATAVANASASA
jgi:hypothetical protein